MKRGVPGGRNMVGERQGEEALGLMGVEALGLMGVEVRQLHSMRM